MNIESVRETFYNKLNQNTSLLTNHNFASIITEINKEIKHHIQQRYPITYTSKGKGKLQTLAVTPQRIQPPIWKKTRVELHSSILQRIHPMHSVDLSTTVTYAKDFEAAELEANYAQAVNLAMNRLSELDSKLKQFMTPEDTTFSNPEIKQQQPLTNNIPSATITENESLDAIFPFELEKLSDVPLFSGTVLEEKPITVCIQMPRLIATPSN
ncbi:hypothetical protein G9A89_006848 [Geosiphon pyriformis]|nr:hypothetical protein G9A89_006848 [Geosiphon pyriformis]